MTTLRPAVVVEDVDLPVQFREILALYRAHEWTHGNDPARLRTAIESSATGLVALDGEQVVGFARAMSDEAFAVYIADVLVHPERQRQGIGRALVEAILERYPLDRFHHQVLIAERGAEGFYRRLGLVAVGNYGLTAFLRTHE